MKNLLTYSEKLILEDILSSLKEEKTFENINSFEEFSINEGWLSKLLGNESEPKYKSNKKIDNSTFSEILDKAKQYLSKGVLTVAMLATLVSIPGLSPAQQSQLKQEVSIEQTIKNTPSKLDEVLKVCDFFKNKDTSNLKTSKSGKYTELKGDGYLILKGGKSGYNKETYTIIIGDNPNNPKSSLTVYLKNDGSISVNVLTRVAKDYTSDYGISGGIKNFKKGDKLYSMFDLKDGQSLYNEVLNMIKAF